MQLCVVVSCEGQIISMLLNAINISEFLYPYVITQVTQPDTGFIQQTQRKCVQIQTFYDKFLGKRFQMIALYHAEPNRPVKA